MRTPEDPAMIVSRGWLARLVLPAGIHPGALPLLVGRALRGFCDGFIAVLLPAYLLALGFAQLAVGLVSSATLIGSALATVLVGIIGHRYPQRRLLMSAAALMAATGIGFAGLSSLWPLLLVAFVGTLNPSSGDVSVFLPLEHAGLADSACADARTALFARYSLTGALCAAIGALAAALPDWLAAQLGVPVLSALRAMFMVYALTGAALWFLYARMPEPPPHLATARVPLGPSRRIVTRLALLFSVDAFAGGLVVNSLLALWLMQRFGLSIGAAGQFFFWAGLLSAGSQLVAAPLARRFGLLNTMVFTHIPSSLCLIAAAFSPSLPATLALLLVRSALSQMDVPTRTAYVMAVVTPPERPAAASLTAVPRSLAAAFGPTLAGALLAMGWVGTPLVACGVLKIAYDLALLGAFRRVKPLD
ncbi:Transporter major facilitator superfamily(MFS) [Cupriavidus necator]|uniref:MFS transporter n=2 Tax=Cupriavidus necator (strain ATCC 17699 / DSM 428 / KCTC 22496 / NCIMB 10442 / H16 / Stanier 337) TaxID=381666 RepID=A0AAE5ZI17_CUPNH|nr:MFS transporter [Cupriavidus necator]KUE85336.1 ABC transporter permease [Cupriavidus necator]QCC03585.1 MFS transporter [Cupriavidus necator H16]QQB80639.1 MFS transporter [Cupriavidus necator]WKA44925.1 MFS transporter [Cupriavidus necator]